MADQFERLISLLDLLDSDPDFEPEPEPDEPETDAKAPDRGGLEAW